MIIKCQKHKKTGNDFIIIDKRTAIYDLSQQIVEHN